MRQEGAVSVALALLPRCGHCKALTPDFARAAKLLTPDGVLLAKVDATVEIELAERFGIDGYPTLKRKPRQNLRRNPKPRALSATPAPLALRRSAPRLCGASSKATAVGYQAERRHLRTSVLRFAVFRKGDSAEYQGPRHVEGIVATMPELAAPAARHLVDSAALEQQLGRLYAGVTPEPLLVLFAHSIADVESPLKPPLVKAFQANSRSPALHACICARPSS